MVSKKDMDNWINGNFSDIDRHGLIAIGKFWEQEVQNILDERSER